MLIFCFCTIYIITKCIGQNAKRIWFDDLYYDPGDGNINLTKKIKSNDSFEDIAIQEATIDIEGHWISLNDKSESVSFKRGENKIFKMSRQGTGNREFFSPKGLNEYKSRHHKMVVLSSHHLRIFNKHLAKDYWKYDLFGPVYSANGYMQVQSQNGCEIFVSRDLPKNNVLYDLTTDSACVEFAQGRSFLNIHTGAGKISFSGQMRNGKMESGSLDLTEIGGYKEIGLYNSAGKLHGKGKRVYPKNEFYIESFEGEFDDGMINGNGVFYFRVGDKKVEIRGTFHGMNALGKCELFSSDGAYYYGEIDSLRPHGFGRMTDPNGIIYEGYFNHQIHEGKAKLLYPSGTKYEGDFKNDRFHGLGKFTLRNGIGVEGAFEYGQPKGDCIVFYPDSTKEILFNATWKSFAEKVEFYKNKGEPSGSGTMNDQDLGALFIMLLFVGAMINEDTAGPGQNKNLEFEELQKNRLYNEHEYNQKIREFKGKYGEGSPEYYEKVKDMQNKSGIRW